LDNSIDIFKSLNILAQIEDLMEVLRFHEEKSHYRHLKNYFNELTTRFA